MTEATEDENCNQLPKDKQTKGGCPEDNEPDDEHLKREELRLLLGGSLSGESLVAALIHLENCSKCQQKLPPVKAKTLLKAVFGEEE